MNFGNLTQIMRRLVPLLVLILVAYYAYSLYRVGYVSTPVDPTDRELGCYMARYPDLNAAFKGDVTLARQHWYKTGALEGRIPHCPRNIDPTMNAPPLSDKEARQYLMTYTDLQRVYGKDNLEGARAHWQSHGFREGRVTSQGWNSDLPSKLFLMGSRREGCKPDAYGKLKCQGQLESLAVKHLGDEVISLTTSDNKYCGDSPNGQGVVCTSSMMGPGEMFTYQKIGQSKITLRSGLTQKYCRNNEGQVLCDADDPFPFQFAMTSPPSASNSNTRSKAFPPPTTWVEPPPPPPPPSPLPASTAATPTTMAKPTARDGGLWTFSSDRTTARDGTWWSFFFR